MRALVRSLAIALLLCAGCKGDDRGAAQAASRQRVNAVHASAADAPDPAEVCDVLAEPAEAPALSWPALTAAAPEATAGTWRWINVWATWCKPCIEELPRLAAWRERLSRAGVKLELTFVSADADDEAVARFRAEHPDTPDSVRLESPDVLEPWLESLGVPGASLPVHVFVDPGGRVRCVRASAVGDADYDAIAALLGA